MNAPAHAYLSTACLHNIHNRCRKRCKWCHAECTCDCHEHEPPEERKAS